MKISRKKISKDLVKELVYALRAELKAIAKSENYSLNVMEALIRNDIVSADLFVKLNNIELVGSSPSELIDDLMIKYEEISNQVSESITRH